MVKCFLPHRDTQNRKMEHMEDRHTNSVCEVTWDANIGLKNQRMYMAGGKRLTFDSSSSSFILLVSDVILCAYRDALFSAGKSTQGSLPRRHHVTDSLS